MMGNLITRAAERLNKDNKLSLIERAAESLQSTPPPIPPTPQATAPNGAARSPTI